MSATPNLDKQASGDAAKVFASVLLANTPPSADQTAAIRKVREAVMTANQGIACDTNSMGQTK